MMMNCRSLKPVSGKMKANNLRLSFQFPFLKCKEAYFLTLQFNQAI